MDLGKLINDIASEAGKERGDDQRSRQHLGTAGRGRAQEAEPVDDNPRHFRNLEDLRRLDDDGWHQLVDRVQPDDLVIVLAGVSERVGLRILAPLDDESQQWLLKNAQQLGTPTPHLRDAAADRILAVAEKLVADGTKLAPADAPPSVAVGFGSGGSTGGSTTVTVGSAPAAGPVSGSLGPRQTDESAAADQDLLRILADLLALQEQQGRAAVVGLAEDAPHPLLTNGLPLLEQCASRNELDQRLLDLQDEAERRFRAQCELVRDGLTALYASEKPTDFLARHSS